jgi:hypothetical protein
MRKHLLSFLAGFLATLLFHQPALWLLSLAGLTDRPIFVMTPVPPFGVPAVISLAFWGGVWGVVMIPVISRTKHYWLAAALFGAILPTLVAAFVVAPLKGGKLAGGGLKLLVAGLVINAAWGLGTAAFYRWLTPRVSTTST